MIAIASNDRPGLIALADVPFTHDTLKYLTVKEAEDLMEDLEFAIKHAKERK